MTIPSNFDLTTPQGWQCPKCGKIWAPSMISCPHCNQPHPEVIMPEKTYVKLFKWDDWAKYSPEIRPSTE
jgi:uncharacterized OB-fold protein